MGEPHALVIHRQVCDAGHETRLGVTWLLTVILGRRGPSSPSLAVKLKEDLIELSAERTLKRIFLQEITVILGKSF